MHACWLVMFASLGLAFGPADQAARAALPLLANADEGKSLYKASCLQCHGSNGLGDGDLGVPTLAGQNFGYLVRQLAAFSDDRRDSATMRRVIEHAALKSPQLWVDVAAYLRELPPPGKTQIGPGDRTALGREIFHEQCAGCHGHDARGDDADFIPSLRNQHYSYLAHQIVFLAESRRHSVDQKLVQFLQGFGGTDIDAVADYLSRLRGERGSGER